MHRWEMIVGSKQFLNDPRVDSLIVGNFYFEQDFTDAMLITNTNEVQSSGFGGVGGKKVSTEGYLTKNVSDYETAIHMNFHSCMSDSTVQEARTVCCHLRELIKKLREGGKFKKWQRLPCVTDGCAKASFHKCLHLHLIASIFSLLLLCGFSFFNFGFIILLSNVNPQQNCVSCHCSCMNFALSLIVVLLWLAMEKA